jgi:hypothetical protein
MVPRALSSLPTNGREEQNRETHELGVVIRSREARRTTHYRDYILPAGLDLRVRADGGGSRVEVKREGREIF